MYVVIALYEVQQYCNALREYCRYNITVPLQSLNL